MHVTKIIPTAIKQNRLEVNPRIYNQLIFNNVCNIIDERNEIIFDKELWRIGYLHIE